MLKIDEYAYSSRLKHIHPAEKAVLSAGCLLFSVITQNMWIALCVSFLMCLLTVWAAGIPLTYYVKLLLLPAMFLATGTLPIFLSIIPADAESAGIWHANIGSWKLYIDESGIEQACHLAAGAAASVLCLYFLILTTPVQQIMWLLQKLKLPGIVLDLTGFTYRFIFVLLEKSREIHLAQTSRLGYQNRRTWLASMAKLAAGLFIKSIMTARELETAIESRGGSEGLYRMDIRQETRAGNWIAVLIIQSMLLILTLM